MKHIIAAVLAVALAAPAHAQSPEQSLAQDLTNCAGAIAAFADIDVPTFQGAARAEGWPGVMAQVLAAMNREEGVEGMTGRYAASAAKSYWSERPRAEQEAAASECRARFASP